MQCNISPKYCGVKDFQPLRGIPPGSKMRLINVLLTVIFTAISSVLSTSQIGTGIQNQASICYMNALLSCLYDVTPFRKVNSMLRVY